MDTEDENEALEDRQYFIDSSDEKVMQVFSNPLVWNVFGRHLDYLDLKEYRLVCSGFNKMITEETDFYERTLIDLTDFCRKFSETGRLVDWRHVKIDVSRLSRLLQADEVNNEEDNEGREKEQEGDGTNEEGLISHESGELNALMRVMKNVESLFLYSSDEAVAQSITKLLEFANSLKKLSFDFTNITVKLSELNRKKLKLSETLKEVEFKATPPSGRGIGPVYPYKACGSAVKIIRLLALQDTKLEVIKIKKILPELRLVTGDELQRVLLNCCSSLLSFVKQHASHLRVLEISDPTLWVLANRFKKSPLRDEPPPGLKSLTAEVTYDPGRTNAENLAYFIRIRTQLHEVRVKCTDFFPQVLFDAIKTQGQTLKKLSIATKRFLVQEEGIWSFLTDTEIEAFELVLEPINTFCSGAGTMDAVFSSFPNTMKKIAIRGFPARMSATTGVPKKFRRGELEYTKTRNLQKISPLFAGFWGYEAHFTYDGVDTLESATPLTNFHSINPELLSELELSSCGGNVSDETVQLICKKFLLLQKLDISKAQRVTDYGLTGEKDDGLVSLLGGKDDGLVSLAGGKDDDLTGGKDDGLIGEKGDIDEAERATISAMGSISIGERPEEVETTGANISNLKELKYLNLNCCTGISDKTLIHGIKFLRLQFLDLSGVPNVTLDGCSLLKSEIPRLQILRGLSFVDEDWMFA